MTSNRWLFALRIALGAALMWMAVREATAQPVENAAIGGELSAPDARLGENMDSPRQAAE